jgi:hypothetical protein
MVVVNTGREFSADKAIRHCNSHDTQMMLDKDKPGATIVPVIISTDKTLLTLFRNKQAYPMYLTIGNIPKEIHHKPSCHTYVLLGYLPMTRLENEPNAASCRHQLANLYHACMAQILSPLRHARESGVFMTMGDGITYRDPLLACFAGDYPEQVLTTATFTGQYPVCLISHDQLGAYNRNTPTGLCKLELVLQALDSFDEDPTGFLQVCKGFGIKPIVNPFWKDLPYVHIYHSITPDVLHQLY